MRQLIKNDVVWNWTRECQKELDDIKNALTSHPVMAYPDWNKDFIITTDASGLGVGGILSQMYPQGDRVIAYTSRSLTDCEFKYGISELECLAVMNAIDRVRVRLGLGLGLGFYPF